MNRHLLIEFKGNLVIDFIQLWITNHKIFVTNESRPSWLESINYVIVAWFWLIQLESLIIVIIMTVSVREDWRLQWFAKFTWRLQKTGVYVWLLVIHLIDLFCSKINGSCTTFVDVCQFTHVYVKYWWIKEAIWKNSIKASLLVFNWERHVITPCL